MIKVDPIEPVIQAIHGQRVILDSDLAKIYGVTAKRLNEQSNAISRGFRRTSCFGSLPRSANRSQIATGSQKHRDPRSLPYAFTEHGAVMAANVLNSEQAVAMSVFVVRAFVKLRKVLSSTDKLAKTLDDLERKLTSRQNLHEKAILQLFAQMRDLLKPSPPQPESKRRRIGFQLEAD